MSFLRIEPAVVTMADRAEVGIDPLHHGWRAVAELSRLTV
jgi:hypothetical protein